MISIYIRWISTTIEDYRNKWSLAWFEMLSYLKCLCLSYPTLIILYHTRFKGLVTSNVSTWSPFLVTQKFWLICIQFASLSCTRNMEHSSCTLSTRDHDIVMVRYSIVWFIKTRGLMWSRRSDEKLIKCKQTSLLWT